MENMLSAALGRKTVDFVDCDGVPHKAPMLTGRDLADIEQEFKGEEHGWGGAVRTFRGSLSVLWHSLRKEGLSREDVRAGKWRWSREDVGEMFPAGSLVVLLQVVVQIMRASGFEDENVRPTSAAPPQTGAPSSPVPSGNAA